MMVYALGYKMFYYVHTRNGYNLSRGFSDTLANEVSIGVNPYIDN